MSTPLKWRHVGFACVNLAGVVAFAMPFFLGAAPAAESRARSGEAPYLTVLLVAMLIVVALTNVAERSMTSVGIALLSSLSAMAALARLPVSLAGANLIYLVPILAGFTLGPTFGFMTGTCGMLLSAILTGGVGPWVPFQMWAMGWVGAGAGLFKPLSRKPLVGVAVLAVYGYMAAIFYGAAMNLYFWPVVSLESAVTFSPGLGFAGTARRYLNFYVLTSFAWDAFGGFFNAVVIALVGLPGTRMLLRYRSRMEIVEQAAPT